MEVLGEAPSEVIAARMAVHGDGTVAVLETQTAGRRDLKDSASTNPS
jgi:hypothetical protein